jgi:alanine dehydrogenase
LGIEVTPVDDPKKAVVGMDIVCTATNATSPVFRGDWVEPGMLVACIVGDDPMKGFGLTARHEFDETTISRSDVIVVNTRLHSKNFEGILWHASKKGLIDFESVKELSDLATGSFLGRSTDDQIILYHNSGGMGIQWPGLATRIYERAKEKGLGRDLPHDWFTTSIEAWIKLGYHPST